MLLSLKRQAKVAPRQNWNTVIPLAVPATYFYNQPHNIFLATISLTLDAFNINGKWLQHFLEMQNWWAWMSPRVQQMEQDHEYQWECLHSFSYTLACTHKKTICLEKPLHDYLRITWNTTKMESKTCLSACLVLGLGASPLLWWPGKLGIHLKGSRVLNLTVYPEQKSWKCNWKSKELFRYFERK